ncbi:MAG: YeeE/YedE thiosulfate transporter family protein [Cellvibrionales bacterium]|nr:YeeE/YedE thiosulfate transporter family protein [Cellvibrionales bacterium]
MNTLTIPLIGGLLIGFSVVLAYAVFGKIAGISGITWQATVQLRRFRLSSTWPWLFLIGLPLGGLLSHTFFDLPNPSQPSTSLWLIIVSGFLVGFGSKLGNGCTSGHGICGVSRFSRRSFVATIIFILTGMITTETMQYVGTL